MAERNIYCGRVCPRTRENGGPVSREPARASGIVTCLAELDPRLASTVLGGQTVRLPIFPNFVIPIGGGRSIGGGTSKEALQRARRKARVSGSR